MLQHSYPTPSTAEKAKQDSARCAPLPALGGSLPVLLPASSSSALCHLVTKHRANSHTCSNRPIFQPSALRPQRASEGRLARGILELRGGMQVIRWGAGLVHRHEAGASRLGIMPRVFLMCGWCGLCRGQARCVWASSSGHVLGPTIEGLGLLLCVCGEVRGCASLCT